jgi:formylglycine-generating enzyme required for sulfatase activity
VAWRDGAGKVRAVLYRRFTLVGFTLALALASSRGAPAATDSTRAAESNFRIADLGLELAWIRPGTFAMGSSRAGDGDERPVTQVTLTAGFWLGVTEITQKQWLAVMARNPSSHRGDRLPVDSVTWTEAREFCRRLTERERAAGRLPPGLAYTLPTEAQWEYACRAGTTGDYAGDAGAMAWFGSNSGYETHPVGTKLPNAWGLHDMHGNVWEWCLDWYGNYPGGSVMDPVGPVSGVERVFRGGSWGDVPAAARSSFRNGRGPDFRLGSVGLRVALAPSSRSEPVGGK